MRKSIYSLNRLITFGAVALSAVSSAAASSPWPSELYAPLEVGRSPNSIYKFYDPAEWDAYSLPLAPALESVLPAADLRETKKIVGFKTAVLIDVPADRIGASDFCDLNFVNHLTNKTRFYRSTGRSPIYSAIIKENSKKTFKSAWNCSSNFASSEISGYSGQAYLTFEQVNFDYDRYFDRSFLRIEVFSHIPGQSVLIVSGYVAFKKTMNANFLVKSLIAIKLPARSKLIRSRIEEYFSL